jgi:ribosomal protein S18 acetylase RimI-like enzyme
MPLRLRPIRDDEFQAFVDVSRARYADDIERNANLPHAEAQRKALQDFASLLPGDRPAEGQDIFIVEDEESGEAVGRIWLAVREHFGRPSAFLYDITIDERVRGRGYGRQAMLLLEEEVRRRGLRRIALNVFGGNERARSLYRSLGYREDSVWMGKELDD